MKKLIPAATILLSVIACSPLQVICTGDLPENPEEWTQEQIDALECDLQQITTSTTTTEVIDEQSS